jgi:hypothetical protein
MRRCICILLLLLLMVLAPLTLPTPAQAENLGNAGIVDALPGYALDVWEMPDGNILYVNETGSIAAFSIANNSFTLLWRVNHTLDAIAAAVDGSWTRIAISHTNGVKVISLSIPRVELYNIAFADDTCSDLAWDADGDLWLGLRKAKHAKEYRTGISTGKNTTAHASRLEAIAILSAGDVVTAGRDQNIRVHDYQGTYVQTLSNFSGVASKLDASISSSTLYVLTESGRFMTYNTSSFAVEQDYTLNPGGLIRSIKDVGGGRLVVGTANGNAHLIDSNTNTHLMHYSIPGELVGAMPADGAGIYILSAFPGSSDVVLLDADRDADGIVDGFDAFPDDMTQSVDQDGDGYGDNRSGNNADAFPTDPTQWSDQDGDGFGDNPDGSNPDAFINNSDQHLDSDGDGYGDNRFGQDGDQFGAEPSQWSDHDGDGFGDNMTGVNPDDCPFANGFSSEDRAGCPDSDGDGWSNPDDFSRGHPDGTADAYPNEVTQWRNTDGDGYGDNPDGYRSDACVGIWGNSTRMVFYIASENRYTTDIPRYGCIDRDGDGYDDTTESSAPACDFSRNKTEWLDADRDCLGSNVDYNDSDPAVQTIEQHCIKHEDDNSLACQPFREVGGVVLNGTPATGDGLNKDRMFDDLAKFTIPALGIGGGLIAMLLILWGLVGILRTASAKRKPDAQYSHQDATKEIESSEEGEEYTPTGGGLIKDSAWGDEPVADGEVQPLTDEEGMWGEDASDAMPTAARALETTEQTEEAPAADAIQESTTTTTASTVTDAGAQPNLQEGEWSQQAGGMQVYEQPQQDPAATAAAQPAAQPQPVAEPAPQPQPAAQPAPAAAAQSGPPLPPGGLPEGWTTEQWAHYGQKWLDKHGN